MSTTDSSTTTSDHGDCAAPPGPEIRHLVFSGGGPVLLQSIAAVAQLESSGFLRRDRLRTIYGTSAGFFVAVCVAMRVDREFLLKYLVQRPWHEVFSVGAAEIWGMWTSRGLFGRRQMEQCIAPILRAGHLSTQITLREFVRATGIDVRAMVFDVNAYQMVEIAAESHGDLELVDVLHMTCAIPLLMQPCIRGRACFLDGGIACNYPLAQSLAASGEPAHTLGFRNVYAAEHVSPTNATVDESSTLLDFLLTFLFRAIFRCAQDAAVPAAVPAWELEQHTDSMSVQSIQDALHATHVRQSLVDRGTADARRGPRPPHASSALLPPQPLDDTGAHTDRGVNGDAEK